MPKRRALNSGFANPEMAEEVLVHLLSVAKGTDFQLAPEMLEEIEAISIEGADPDWQISELRKILDRWITQH